jgi:Family of unknown function (DUF6492)
MAGPGIAFITPSYAGDIERCRLLCDSMDRMAECDFRHYVLVADHDLPMFQPLAGPRRDVVPDSALLPPWLTARRRPFAADRWIWTSLMPPVWPMSGWHVQQLRKMLIARHIEQDVLVMADSDSVFVRPFGESAFMREGLVRFYVQENGITADHDPYRHGTWVRQAAEVLGLPPPALPAHDYINNLVTWRRDLALAMLERIEAVSSRDVAAAMGRSRSFSEYLIYGAYVDGLADRSGHFADEEPLSLTYWSGEALTPQTLRAFTAGLSERQIAVCIQSFTGTPTEVLRDQLMERASAL